MLPTYVFTVLPPSLVTVHCSGIVVDIVLGTFPSTGHWTFNSTSVGTRRNHLVVITTLELGVVLADLSLHVAGCAVT